jgi:hypothetical protein
MRKILVFAVLVLACAVVTAQANDLGTSGGSGGAVVRDIIHPLAPQQITQNLDPNTLEDNSGVSCGSAGITTDNGWWRLFDLDGDHGLTGQFCVEDLDWGVDSCTGAQEIFIRSYCLDDGNPFYQVFLSQQGESSTTIADGANEEFVNTAVGGCCDADTQSMAIGIFAPDCLESGLCTNFFIGGNKLGQTAPSYLSAEDCGAPDPTDVADFGFTTNAWLMVVNGDGTGGDDGGTGDGGTDDGGVPATTGIGLMLLVLALGGGSAYFLRRK